MTPEMFSDMLNAASLKHFKRKLGLPEEYRPGMPLPSQAFEITKKITADMRHFKVVAGWDYAPPITVDSEGKAKYPDDYYIAAAVSYNLLKGSEIYERKVEILSDLEFLNATTSFTEKPDEFFPVCNMQAGFIRFAPKNLLRVNMVYLRLPKKPIYKTKQEDGYTQYDDKNSVNLEWDDINKLDILILMLQDMGVSISRKDIYEYANQIKERGV